MAFAIVDGRTGTKHISSDDLSALNVATIGKADCVLKYGDNFKLTMANANTATLGTGVGMVGGKRFWNQAATSLTIQSGTQGQKRNDLVVARYAKTSAGIESITPVVIKGTPTTGTAADPEVTANDLKLWRVPLDGISVGEPVQMFSVMKPLAAFSGIVSSSAWLTRPLTAPSGWSISTSSSARNQISAYPLLGMVEITSAFVRSSDSTIPTTTMCNLNDVGMGAYKPARDLSIPNVTLTSGTGSSAQYKQTNIVIKTNGDIIIGSSQTGRSISIWTGLFSLVGLH